MISNYFKTAWRNLWNNKLLSGINILGLSAGLCCCILIFLFIQHELSHDKFNRHEKNIYRLTSVSLATPSAKELAVAPAPWAPLMKKDFPEIKEFTRLLKDEKVVAGRPALQRFYETKLLFADSTFFNVFSIELTRGDKTHALEKPNSIILTEETARKYFGESDPVGQTLEISSFGRNLNVEVTAVAKKLPATSHFSFDLLVSMQTLGDLSEMWAFHMFQSYLLLNENVNSIALQKKFEGFVNKYIANNPQADGKNEIFLQPLSDIHLRSHLIGELDVNGDIAYVYVFAGVAIFILLIACFNFTNLTTARSFTRAKEVGLRKVVGAQKKQVVAQFLTETSLFALISLVLAVGLTYIVLPVFNSLSGRELTIEPSNNYSLLLTLLLLTIGVGLVAGAYPAILFSAFKPIEVLKGKFNKSRRGISLRKLLVTVQFVVSIALIASTIIVSNQLNFLRNKKLGFEKENVILVTLPRTADSITMASFRNSLLSQDDIVAVTASSSIPSDVIAVNQVNDGNLDLTKAISMQMLFTDFDFVKTMKMELLAGRDLDRKQMTDRWEGFVLNEEAVKQFGWRDAQSAIGKTVQWVIPSSVEKRGRVIGVVKDFNITPLKSAVMPLVMHYLPARFQYLYVRVKETRAQAALTFLQTQFKNFFTNQSFEFSYLDETLNNLYTREQKLGKVFTYFSFLAILISCLGVLGLSIYSIQQRVKELGIRKVLGASVVSLMNNLLKEFLKPVFLAALVATPVTWFAINKWLQGFAYHIDISWTIFLITTLMVLLLAILMMIVQVVRAALANPVKSLRSE